MTAIRKPQHEAFNRFQINTAASPHCQPNVPIQAVVKADSIFGLIDHIWLNVAWYPLKLFISFQSAEKVNKGEKYSKIGSKGIAKFPKSIKSQYFPCVELCSRASLSSCMGSISWIISGKLWLDQWFGRGWLCGRVAKWCYDQNFAFEWRCKRFMFLQLEKFDL